MERRKFIKKSGVVTAGAAILPLIPGTAQAASRIEGGTKEIFMKVPGILRTPKII